MKSYCERDAHLKLSNLEKGSYHIYVEFQWNETTSEDHREFNIVSYSKKEAEIEMKDTERYV